jgi:hypothetical protein
MNDHLPTIGGRVRSIAIGGVGGCGAGAQGGAGGSAMISGSGVAIGGAGGGWNPTQQGSTTQWVGGLPPHIDRALTDQIHQPLTKADLFAPRAPALLDKAKQLMVDRAKQYDKPEGERSMGKAVEAFNAITGRDLTEPEGWLLLQVLKDVRLFQRDGYHADSAEDCIAYAALKAEAKARTAW